jgi:GH18 family chitinase
MNTDATSEPATLAYYEAFNNQRPCLNLDPQAIMTLEVTGGEDGSLAIDSAYSYIHFAFANITEDFQVDIGTVKDEFEEFKQLAKPKDPTGKEINQGKVLSFGGWSFSTDLDSYAIFRKGVTDAQRSQFATNVVQFATDNNLDGLDFDWEYPGAPDIPGIPHGDPDDGERYYNFLKEVRDKLPSGKTVSVAVPASFWYLKGFPIKKISDVVDYIVFMTYDLHGQWDYDKPNGSDGCDGGSCLRSHVNETETALAFAMITKAGVPNNKIFGGVASYGRSFGMADPSCYGPTCKFTGPESGARPGECTQTAGYIANAEIGEWLADENEKINTYYDEKSASIISYSESGTWVAYSNKANRTARLLDWWQNGHFAGTALWALDLTEFVSEDSDGSRLDAIYPTNCTQSFDNMDDLEAATGLDDFCVNIYLMQALSGNLTASLKKYQEILDDEYDKKFGWYEEAVRESAPLNLQSFLKANDTKYFDCIQNGDADGYTNHTDKGCVHDRELGLIVDVYWSVHDKEQFETDLTATTGISPEWLRWDMDPESYHDSSTGDHGTTTNYGKPWLKTDYTIDNPKDMISKRLPNITAFHESLDFTAGLANYSLYSGDTSDVVDGASTVVFMVSSAVTSMSRVEDIGENYEEQKIINAILWFVTAVLFLIPGLEEGAEALELGTLAASLRMIGTAGDVGMSVYDVVNIKENGPAAVLGILLAGAGALSMIKAPAGFANAAKARRAISATHIDALGTEVKGGMAQVEKLIQRCY